MWRGGSRRRAIHSASCSSRWPGAHGGRQQERGGPLISAALALLQPGRHGREGGSGPGARRLRVWQSSPSGRLLRNFKKATAAKHLTGMARETVRARGSSLCLIAGLCCPRTGGYPGRAPQTPLAPVAGTTALRRPQRLGSRSAVRRAWPHASQLLAVGWVRRRFAAVRREVSQ